MYSSCVLNVHFFGFFLNALKIKPTYPGVHNSLGILLREKGNTKLAEELVYRIINWLGKENPKPKIIEAHCGVGTISLPLAHISNKLIGYVVNYFWELCNFVKMKEVIYYKI